MRLTVAALAFGTLLAGGPVVAQQNGQDTGTVVELFTSQGCSSCPPADQILGQLAARDDVIALALHVDYWDYIGWADDLADPGHSARQRGYAKAWGERNIYTPQMVVAGVAEFVGSHPVVAMDAVASHPASGNPVRITLDRTGDRLTVTAAATGPVPPQAVVQLVRYAPEITREITRGENAGKTLVYHNVVTQWSDAAVWATAEPLSLTLDVTGDAPIVVIVQDGAAGPILGAVRLR